VWDISIRQIYEPFVIRVVKYIIESGVKIMRVNYNVNIKRSDCIISGGVVFTPVKFFISMQEGIIDFRNVIDGVIVFLE